MKDFALVLVFTAATAISWGVYGPVLNKGTGAMGGSHLRPFIGVGLAYFVIAVIVPLVLIKVRNEAGRWTRTGFIWSFAAGAAGALGALGVIMAFKFHGMPAYVMPVVFGCAPVVNTFTTMWMNRTHAQPSPIFYAGLILVAAGAVTVLFYKPGPAKPAASPPTQPAASASAAKSSVAEATAPVPPSSSGAAPTAAAHGPASAAPITNTTDMMFVTLFVGLTAICWGVYGPLLHKGQAAMQGSRLRPLVCVGLAYFVIGVIIPSLLLSTDHGHWTTSGMIFSLAGGATGALGALGLILAFASGGKPIYVMPLVFGCAPVINTFLTIGLSNNVGDVSPMFYAGLIVVMAGAVTVLIFAPRAGHKPAVEANESQAVAAH